MKRLSIMFSLVLALFLCLAACTQQYDDENDFRITPIDGGRSVEITEYVGRKQTVRIPPRLQGMSVTGIREGVFQEKELVSVTIPNSMTTIGERAFMGNQLISVTIPNSVTAIEKEAFRGNQLTKVTIGNSVKTIGESAFRENPLVSVTIPNSVTVIGDFAFWGAWDSANDKPLGTITSVSIGNGVTAIGDNAFENNSLTRVTIPNSVITMYPSIKALLPLEKKPV